MRLHQYLTASIGLCLFDCVNPSPENQIWSAYSKFVSKFGTAVVRAVAALRQRLERVTSLGRFQAPGTIGRRAAGATTRRCPVVSIMLEAVAQRSRIQYSCTMPP
jgi:hypothetical protein